MGITVAGKGEATGAPDKVDLDVGVSVIAASVADATTTAADSGQAVLAALRSAGVAETDLATTGYSLQPEYEYSDNKRRLVGYRAGNTIQATVRNVSAAGRIIDAVAGAAGDYARVNRVNFGIEDDEQLRAEARSEAWEDALAKAAQLAELSGRALGRATTINEGVRSPIVPIRRAAADPGLADVGGTPIEPGITTVSVDLEIEFEFAD